MVNRTLLKSPRAPIGTVGVRGCWAAHAHNIKCYSENYNHGAVVYTNGSKAYLSFKLLFEYKKSVQKKFGKSQFQICYFIVFLSKDFYCSTTERTLLKTIFKYTEASFGIVKIPVLLILFSNLFRIPTEAWRMWLCVCVCTPTDPYGIKTHNQIIYEQCIL